MKFPSPRKLAQQWNTTIFNERYMFKWWTSHCYASLLGCIINSTGQSVCFGLFDWNPEIESLNYHTHTVDGSEILHQSVVYPVIYWVLYIPGGAAVRMLVEKYCACCTLIPALQALLPQSLRSRSKTFQPTTTNTTTMTTTTNDNNATITLLHPLVLVGPQGLS